MSRFLAAVIALALLATASCGEPGAAASDGKISVVASTNVWGSVVAAVGGDRVSVRSLINDVSADPHAHPDQPQEAAELAGADLAVYNGGGYDDFFTKLIDATGTKARKIDAFALSGYENGGNEHVFYDQTTVKKVADKIAADLGAVDPGQQKRYTANAKTFDTKVDAIAAQAERIGEARPGAKVVATEPVAHYLLDTAGLSDVTPAEFSEAVEEETDPPVSAVAETTGLISDKKVAVLVDNAQTETAVTDSLGDAAKKAGVPVVKVTETLPRGVTDYVEWMTSEVAAFARALGVS
jgi:zinc/manganese transport system substrate-binding protein